jgi:hypothetical protein
MYLSVECVSHVGIKFRLKYILNSSMISMKSHAQMRKGMSMSGWNMSDGKNSIINVIDFSILNTFGNILKLKYHVSSL